MTLATASQNIAPLSSFAGVRSGDRLRFIGKAWTVEGLFRNREQVLFAIVEEADGLRTCIAYDGSDGPWDLLSPSLEASGHGGPGDLDTGCVIPCETAGVSIEGRSQEALSERNPGRAPSAAEQTVGGGASASSASPAVDGGGGHAAPGDPARGSSAAPFETAPPPAIGSPVDDWRFRPRTWRP